MARSFSGQSSSRITPGSVHGHTPVRPVPRTAWAKTDSRAAGPGSGTERSQVGRLGADLTARVGRGRFVQTGVFLPLGALVLLELFLDLGLLATVTAGRIGGSLGRFLGKLVILLGSGP